MTSRAIRYEEMVYSAFSFTIDTFTQRRMAFGPVTECSQSALFRLANSDANSFALREQICAH